MMQSVRQGTYYGDTVAPRCAWVTCPGPKVTSTGRSARQRGFLLWAIDTNWLIPIRMGISGQDWMETSGSLIERLLPRPACAATAAGAELKAVLFVLALSIGFLKVAIRAVTA